MQACPISRDVLSIRHMMAPVLLLLPPQKEARPRPCSLPAASIQQEVSSDSSWYFLEGSFYHTLAQACGRDAYRIELAQSGRPSVSRSYRRGCAADAKRKRAEERTRSTRARSTARSGSS